MKRDRRLLIAMLFFAISLVAGLVQVAIVNLYIYAAVMGQAHWDCFIDFFGLEPITKPGTMCFDYCAPPLPLLAGGVAGAAFFAGWIMVAVAWWRPRR
ncbi:hypothetical protein [Sphingomonas sp. CLY1604]|uniref:hypothetical protein n=1 Tax=Sphingomonas sp. CLY1604 TaxID=3457786 RepID=UPI003FD8A2E2